MKVELRYLEKNGEHQTIEAGSLIRFKIGSSVLHIAAYEDVATVYYCGDEPVKVIDVIDDDKEKED